MEAFVVLLIVWAIWGFICVKMADNRGRSRVLGFLAGFIFQFLAVCYYWIVGDTMEEKARKMKELSRLIKAAE